MFKTYQLQYGYMHCVGRTTYSAGSVDTQAKALAWVQSQARDNPPVRVPDEDPVRWCPVRHCHMKRQKPWFAFREAASAGPAEPAPDATCQVKQPVIII